MRHAATFARCLACCIRLSSLISFASHFYHVQVILLLLLLLLLLVSCLPVDFNSMLCTSGLCASCASCYFLLWFDVSYDYFKVRPTDANVN
jgi:hypothetical protein